MAVDVFFAGWKVGRLVVWFFSFFRSWRLEVVGDADG